MSLHFYDSDDNPFEPHSGTLDERLARLRVLVNGTAPGTADCAHG
jgi:hypothetical protein